MSKLIVVAGPAGCGKTAWANYISRILMMPVIHTDYFRDSEWNLVPEKVRLAVEAYGGQPYTILEGVRALSSVKHNAWQDNIETIWWGDYDPQRVNCAGLLTRQQDILAELGLRPKVRLFSRILP